MDDGDMTTRISTTLDNSGLSDYDFMELVVFDRKVESEGSFLYAAGNYAPAFECDGYQPSDDLAQLRDLRREYADRIDEFWRQSDAVDRHNTHVSESSRRDRTRAPRKP